MRVLVVDDAPDVAEALASLARVAWPEATVDVETSGEEALSLARRAGVSRPYDLVVTDHHMGNMSGLDLLVVLARERLARHGVLISGDRDVADYLAATGKPFRFLPKPFEPAQLLAALRIDAVA